MTALADEGTFVSDYRMAGYGAEPTPERPTDDACERRFVAGFCRTAGWNSGALTFLLDIIMICIIHNAYHQSTCFRFVSMPMRKPALSIRMVLALNAQTKPKNSRLSDRGRLSRQESRQDSLLTGDSLFKHLAAHLARHISVLQTGEDYAECAY
jgi:hypothetical protein